MKTAGAVLRFFGWVFMGGFILFAILAAFAFLENSDKSKDALPGIVFFLVAAFVPGILMLKKAKTLRCKGELEDYVTAVDRFTLQDAASRIGRHENETEKWVLEIAAQRRLDLAFDPVNKLFSRRVKVISAEAAEANCPTCGAQLGALRFAEGETPRCPYCNAPIRVE